MSGRLTATLNSNGDVCSIQKAGGEGVISSVVMQCLRIASVKAADITSKIKNTVDAYNTERALRKVKHHSSSVARETSMVDVTMKDQQASDITRQKAHQSDMKGIVDKVENEGSNRSEGRKDSTKAFIGGPSNWDPYSKGHTSSLITSFQASPGPLTLNKETEGSDVPMSTEPHPDEKGGLDASSAVPVEVLGTTQQKEFPKSLKDAVKPKSRRKKRAPSASDGA